MTWIVPVRTSLPHHFDGSLFEAGLRDTMLYLNKGSGGASCCNHLYYSFVTESPMLVRLIDQRDLISRRRDEDTIGLGDIESVW